MNKTNGHLNLAGAVSLGTKVWRCNQGHEVRSEQPTMWQFNVPVGPPVGGRQQVQVYRSGPVCLLCLLEYASQLFPLKEEGGSDAVR